jgi:2-amino-4-hydroxy-6-hydroxymethyldihydropteridine diphosphokinase
VTLVTLGLGSNKQPHHYLTSALDALHAEFGQLNISPVYESESVGFKGSNFYNLVVQLETTLPFAALVTVLQHIETLNGRDRQAPKFSSRTLDIDVLFFGDAVGKLNGVLLPRDEITVNAFVLKPLNDLMPDYIHPKHHKTIQSLWQTYNTPQKLWRIDFKWHDKTISTIE